MKKLIFFLILNTIFCLAFAQTKFACETPEIKQTKKANIGLSLQEAILLAVRDNPNVESSVLSHVTAKFDLWVQQWQFLPHYGFQAAAKLGKTHTGYHSSSSRNYNVQPSVNLKTIIGGQITVSGNTTKSDHFNPGLSMEVTQHLMRGFGPAIVEAALCNARDSELIARLSVEGTLRMTVTNVIKAYLDILTAEKTISIDEKAVDRALKSVEQTKYFIKAGRKAGNELVTVEANVANAKTQLENDKNNLLQARYALLTAIGMDPNSAVNFSTLDLELLINKYSLPPLEIVKQLTLENDINYQSDQITLNGSTSRALLTAYDNTRPILDLRAQASTGGGSGGGWNSGFNSLWNGVNHGQNVELTLQIPIDDQLAQQSLLNAKVALQKARLALMQEKWSKQTGAINGWNLVSSAKRALSFAVDAERLQEKTYNISYQKYLHGLIDSLELQTAQERLIQAQQTLLNARISYLKSLVDLDLLIGKTLRTWHIKVRI